MIFKQWDCVIGSKDPILKWRLRPAGFPNRQPPWVIWPSEARLLFSRGANFKQRRRRPIQHFSWPQLFKFFLNPTRSRFAGEFGRAELSRRKIQSGKSDA